MDERSDSVRILVADDHTLLRDGLCELLAEQPDFEVVGRATDGLEALKLVESLAPDICLLDLRMPRLDGLEVLTRLGGKVNETRVIMVSAVIEKAQIAEAFRLGARGVVMKDAASDSLMRCIRKVMAGQYWMLGEAVTKERALAWEDTAASLNIPRTYGLTGRELEILVAIVAGKTNREIADHFSISEQTVKHHLTHIFDKVGVYNRLELALFAIHHGLASKDRVSDGAGI